MSTIASDLRPGVAPLHPHSWSDGLALAAMTFLLVIVMNILHEGGHALAGKALGYDVVARINHVKLVGGATSATHRLIVDLAGPIVTLVIAAAAWFAARRGSRAALSILFVALAMRIIAAVASLGTPNDEARASLYLGLGMWTLFALVIAFLTALLVSAWRRDRVGWRWFLATYIGASIGFATTVFGEPFFPTITG